MKNLWKKFDQLTDRCYMDLAEGTGEMKNWNDGYAELMKVIEEGRRQDADFAGELYLLDDDTEYQYDVQGWLEDYLDELDMHKMHAELETVCRRLLELFRWEEDSPSHIRFMLASAMESQGKLDEALEFCGGWYEAEPDNMLAGAALIYARMDQEDWEGAERIVKECIPEGTACTDDTDVVFTAAAALYKVSGKKQEEKRINKAINKYEKELEKQFRMLDEEGDLEFGEDFMDIF